MVKEIILGVVMGGFVTAVYSSNIGNEQSLLPFSFGMLLGYGFLVITEKYNFLKVV